MKLASASWVGAAEAPVALPFSVHERLAQWNACRTRIAYLPSFIQLTLSYSYGSLYYECTITSARRPPCYTKRPSRASFCTSHNAL